MNTVFERIESIEYSANVNAASGHRLFRTFVLESPEFVELCEQPAQEIVERIRVLLPNSTPEYANPHDHAIAAYLLALQQQNLWYLTTLARKVFDTKGLFWSRHIAAHIVNENISKIGILK